MEVKLSPKIKREIPSTIKDYGYDDEEEFIKDALRHRILELKKIDFLLKTEEIRKKMKERGLTEEDILVDFEKFSHKK